MRSSGGAIISPVLLRVFLPTVVGLFPWAAGAAPPGTGGTPVGNDAFFVAPDGNDAAKGMRDSPWRTIQHAADALGPAQTAYVRAGIYDEEVVIHNSGRSGAPISLENYPGERPVIDSAFRRQCGIRVLGSWVNIKGFEIRNCKADLGQSVRGMGGIVIAGQRGKGGRRASHCLVARNIVHHVSGYGGPDGGKPAQGIAADWAEDVRIENNTVYCIVGHTESKGIHCDDVPGAIVRRNLVCLCDKEGIRLITQDTDAESIVEGNIALHNHFGIDLNFCRTSRRTIVRNNFCGWNWSDGMNPKHVLNAVLDHNTVYASEYVGINFHGDGTPRGDNYRAVVTNNLLSLNRLAWFILDRQMSGERIDYNFYHAQSGLRLACFSAWDARDPCHSLADIQGITGKIQTISGPYDLHGKEGDPLFVDPAKGDFRLRANSPARRAAEDGKEIGALESQLIEVGAEKRYGLANIPDLGRVPLTIESFSSESAVGRASNVADRNRDSFWDVDLSTDAKAEIVLSFESGAPYKLDYITLVKPRGNDAYFYRQFALFVDDGSGTWKPVPQPPEHPFVGYRGLWNGETWAFTPGTTARKLKVRLLSSYGASVHLSEIRVFGWPATQSSNH